MRGVARKTCEGSGVVYEQGSEPARNASSLAQRIHNRLCTVQSQLMATNHRLVHEPIKAGEPCEKHPEAPALLDLLEECEVMAGSLQDLANDIAGKIGG